VTIGESPVVFAVSGTPLSQEAGPGSPSRSVLTLKRRALLR